MSKENAKLNKNLEDRSAKNLMVFATVIYYLFVEKKKKYDLIFSLGNSGLSMTKLLEITLKDFDVKIPKIISLPVYRYKTVGVYHSKDPKDLFDNSALIPDIKKFISKIPNIQNVLIVDDEIGLGTSVKSSMNLLQQSLQLLGRSDEKINLDVVAEDHGFKSHDKVKAQNIKIYSIGEQIPWTYHIVTYHIPNSLMENVKLHAESKRIGPRQVMNILLDQPVKKRINGKPIFTYAYNKLVKKNMKDFSLIQKKYYNSVKMILSTGINQYRGLNRSLDEIDTNAKVEAWKIFDN